MDPTEMLEFFERLPCPITLDLVLFEEGCQFVILTPREMFSNSVCGAFPVIGPLELSSELHRNLFQFLAGKSNRCLEKELIETGLDSIPEGPLVEVFQNLGEKALWELFRENWPAKKAFYVFHDMGARESAFFPTLQAANKHFLARFIQEGKGVAWSEMDDEELMLAVSWLSAWSRNGGPMARNDCLLETGWDCITTL